MAYQLQQYEEALTALTARNVASLSESINASNTTLGWYNLTLVGEVVAMQKALKDAATTPDYIPPVDTIK